MALFKISKGLSSKIPALNNQNTQDGWCWFTTDDGLFHIDFESNGVLQRKTLNANDAKTLTGASLKQELNNKADEIPSSAVVSAQVGEVRTLISNKMDKKNPTGTGSFSMNSGLAEGDYSIALGEEKAPDDTIASGTNSFAMGFGSVASGYISFAQGEWTIASGDKSHAEGAFTESSGTYSHAEGQGAKALGTDSHAEGYRTQASGMDSHAEGETTRASGPGSHAEGRSTSASGDSSHSEGNSTQASGYASHAEGDDTLASGSASHAEGVDTVAAGNYSHASGAGTEAHSKSQFVIGEYNIFDTEINASSRGDYIFIIGKGTSDKARSNAMTVDWSGNIHGANRLSHGSGHTISADGAYAGGSGNTASGAYSHAEGQGTTANNTTAHAEGTSTTASGNASHAEGISCVASGSGAHAEGNDTEASGNYSHVEGRDTNASSTASHAEGQNTEASGDSSHAEGVGTIASNLGSHAEGRSTTASGEASHAEGYSTGSSGNYSHAEGKSTTAFGESSHAGGESSIATGKISFVHGYFLRAQGENQAVFGKYNSTNATDIFQIGGGTSDTNRKNIFSIDTDGDAQISKSLNIGGLSDNTGEAHTLFVSGPAYFLAGVDTDANYAPTKDTHLVPKKYIKNNLPTLSHKYMIAEEGQTAFDFADQGITSLRKYCLVYYDGLLLIEGIHYNISTSGTAIILLDWMANAGHVVQVVSSAPINPDNSLFN